MKAKKKIEICYRDLNEIREFLHKKKLPHDEELVNEVAKFLTGITAVRKYFNNDPLLILYKAHNERVKQLQKLIDGDLNNIKSIKINGTKGQESVTFQNNFFASHMIAALPKKATTLPD